MAGAPFLANNGFCVYHFNYGNITGNPAMPFQALAPIESAAHDLKRGIDQVLKKTGAKKVDLVGWSQGGGMTPHYYINFLGGDKTVDNLVGIVAGNHGTSGSSLIYIRDLIPPFGRALFDLWRTITPAFPEQAEFSPLVKKIYGEGDTRPGVTYTTIATKYDQIMTPYTNVFLKGDNVTNILLQDGCEVDKSDHLSAVYNERAWRFVLNELRRGVVKSAVPCFPVSPYFPGVGGPR
jgi:pimeloyl-ACP methyl ester carboxylesterase